MGSSATSTEEARPSPITDEVLVVTNQRTRVAILNRPKQLNALSHSMVKSLKQLYQEWENDNNVSLIIIKGSGRAFCAGGDVAATCQYGSTGNSHLANHFFATEYELDHILGTLKKPHVALLDGITMGGGAGVSIHGSIRVATEKTVFSMPETALGLFPDVGASHFLSRLPGYLGEYLGLTGSRLDGADMVTCGLATHFVPSKSLPELEDALKNFTHGGVEDVSDIVDRFAIRVSPQDKSPLHRMKEINNCFSKITMEEIMDALEKEGDKCNGWYKQTAETLRKASPLSLKITLRAIRTGRHQPLRECLILDYRLAVRCLMRTFSSDFYEGVRAILVDKDKKPKWSPGTLEGVTPEMVDYYFSPLKKEESSELQLPSRMLGCVSRL